METLIRNINKFFYYCLQSDTFYYPSVAEIEKLKGRNIGLLKKMSRCYRIVQIHKHSVKYPYIIRQK